MSYPTTTERLRAALAALEYLPNACHAWNVAHGHNAELASANARKCATAERLIGEILASLPKALSYRVIGLEPDVLDFPDRDAFLAWVKETGRTYGGEESPVFGPLRPELKGQPFVSGLAGPMYGGPGVVRYETPEVADALSR